MPTKQDLEQIDAVLLAVMCKKLAKDPSVDAATSAKALQMMQEWVALTEREMPAKPTTQDYDQMEADIDALKSRMAEFLAPFV
jgi:hypothetical protein